jgi:hypothetical protein
MKYFLDTEFLEGKQSGIFASAKPTIDLISIALVDEKGRYYYEVSKDFNLKEAWNRWQPRTGEGDRNILEPKHYWIRENVLRKIFLHLRETHAKWCYKALGLGISFNYISSDDFTYTNMQKLINLYGKPNKDIANDICAFIYGDDCGGSGVSAIEMACKYEINDKSLNPEFYGYYSDYDWVVFCWLFGRMNDLPKGFPMYCRDLKQMLDEVAESKTWYYGRDCWSKRPETEDLQEGDRLATLEEKVKKIKELPEYPKQISSHSALDDAIFNKNLYNFLINFKEHGYNKV